MYLKVYIYIITCIIFTKTCDAVYQKYRLLRGKYVLGVPVSTANPTSRIGCAALCEGMDACDLCNYNQTSRVCELFSQGSLRFSNPYAAGQEDISLMIRRHLRLVYSSNYGDLSQGQAVCAEFGGSVSTYGALEYEFYNKGLHSGSCDMVSNGNVYYSLQYTVEGIGYGGINQCFWTTTGTPFCTVNDLN